MSELELWVHNADCTYIDPKTKKVKNKINARYAGKENPKTGVPYDEHANPIFSAIEGVVVKEARYQLPNDLYQSSDYIQFKNFFQNLLDKMDENPNLRKKFEEEKLIEEIQNAAKGKQKNISGYTVHHSHEEGILELVDYKTHNETKHTGGKVIWGGGNDNR